MCASGEYPLEISAMWNLLEAVSLNSKLIMVLDIAFILQNKRTSSSSYCVAEINPPNQKISRKLANLLNG